MTRTRQPVKPLTQDAAAIRANAAAEKQRKAASKAALKQAAAPVDPGVGLDAEAASKARAEAEQQASEAARAERAKQDAANALAAHRVDFEALMPEDQTWEQYLLAQGVNPDGTPASTAKAGTDKSTYTGPMLALRERAKAGAYVKMANGNPSCADWLATALGALNREQVVQVLMLAMKLESNPYSYLNPGQQSMNLRNKARGMVKNGLLTQADVAQAIVAAAATSMAA